jgi:hypothetical protein
MLTAALTAAVAGLLALFGVKPGRYLVFVAIGIKIVIVAVPLIFGARWLRRRAEPKAADPSTTPTTTPPKPTLPPPGV